MKQPRFYSLAFGSSIMLLFLVSCGSADHGSKAQEFASSSNVNKVTYNLNKLELIVNARFSDKTEQNFDTTYTNQSDLAMTRVVRHTVGGSYTLEVDGQTADVIVGDSSNISDIRSEGHVNGSSDRCNLSRNSKVTGSARYDGLSMNYELNLKLDGDDCAPSITDQFQSLLSGELSRLHLGLIDKLQDSGVWNFKNAKEVRIQIRMSGVSS